MVQLQSSTELKAPPVEDFSFSNGLLHNDVCDGRKFCKNSPLSDWVELEIGRTNPINEQHQPCSFCPGFYHHRSRKILVLTLVITQ